MENYKVDNSARHIKLQVGVGTSGIAVTEVSVTKNDVYISITDSTKNNDKGDIPPIKIGTNKSLLGETIRLRTGIEYVNLTEEQKNIEIDNIFIEYIVTGEVETVKYGVKPDEIDLSDPSFTLVTKYIKCV